MGRGGGGSGGGRSSGGGGRSSGGGGGSRSFGGSSSRSHRGGGSSSHRGGGSFSGSGGSVHYYHHYGRSYRGSRTYYVGSGGTLHHMLSIMVTTLILVFVIVLIVGASGAGIARSTIEREPIKPYGTFSKDCIDDDAGWFTNERDVLKGMESFYKNTGVQPALAVYQEIDGERYLNNSEIEAFMNEEYDGLIGHEKGILVLFCEYESSDYYVYYMAGEDAQTVMDSEACDILMDYVHGLYTNDSYSDEEFFGAVFEKTGERIMTVTPTFASKIPVIVTGVVMIAIAVCALKALKAKHKRDAESASETERILNTHIDRL